MKFLKKIGSALVSPASFGILITLIVAWYSQEYFTYDHRTQEGDSLILDQLNILHEKSIDFRFKLRGEHKSDSKIAILAVDEKSLEQMGHWPWNRDILANTIERLFSYGAKTLAFDIIFSEPDKKSAIPTLERVKRAGGITSTSQPQLFHIIENEMARNNSDEILANAFAKYSQKIISGFYFEPFPSYSKNLGFKDLCLSQIFVQSQPFSFFNKLTPLVTSLDDHEEILPFEWAELVRIHFNSLENQELKKWERESADHKKKLNEFRRVLAKYSLLLKPDEHFNFLRMYIKSSEEFKSAVHKIQPFLIDDSQFESFNNALSNTLDSHAKVLLSRLFETSKLMYCERFWGSQDELMAAFKKAWPSIQAQSKEIQGMSFEDFITIQKSQVLYNPVTTASRWWINIPQLNEKTTFAGFFNALPDSDGTIRKGFLIARGDTLTMNSIALGSYLLGNNLTASAVYTPDTFYDPPIFKKIDRIDVNDSNGNVVNSIPTTPEGYLHVNFSGPQKMFPHISVGELMSSDTTATITERVYDKNQKQWVEKERVVDKSQFIKDTYFIFGATAVGIYDLRVTPFEENFPGVEIHANVLDNILKKTYLKTSPLEPMYMLGSILILGISLSLIIHFTGATWGLLATILTLIAVSWIDKKYFFGRGLIVTILFPLLLCPVIYVVLTFYKYLTEERLKKELRGTFAKYVSPAIVNEVLKDPKNLELGGKKGRMSVMFSDVRGFTTISEKLDPKELSDLLNSYLTPMTEIIFQNKGTLDKYMGDAIMSFFGAPIPFNDHAECAVRCALQQIKMLKILQAQYEAKGLPQIDIGIGVNTGEMSAGNMGSKTVRSYTVMGDAVNLGSRLEGINKQYGTRIIISEFTHAELSPNILCREIDWVKVKGKELPVKIFEVLTDKRDYNHSVSLEQLQELLLYFSKGTVLYHQQLFAEAREEFNKCLQIWPEDPVSELYVERCSDYLEKPPGDQWDGVFVMTTK